MVRFLKSIIITIAACTIVLSVSAVPSLQSALPNLSESMVTIQCQQLMRQQLFDQMDGHPQKTSTFEYSTCEQSLQKNLKGTLVDNKLLEFIKRSLKQAEVRLQGTDSI